MNRRNRSRTPTPSPSESEEDRPISVLSGYTFTSTELISESEVDPEDVFFSFY